MPEISPILNSQEVKEIRKKVKRILKMLSSPSEETLKKWNENDRDSYYHFWRWNACRSDIDHLADEIKKTCYPYPLWGTWNGKPISKLDYKKKLMKLGNVVRLSDYKKEWQKENKDKASQELGLLDADYDNLPFLAMLPDRTRVVVVGDKK